MPTVTEGRNLWLRTLDKVGTGFRVLVAAPVRHRDEHTTASTERHGLEAGWHATDVIIVGAGLSGLAAAREVLDAGRERSSWRPTSGSADES